LAVAKSWLTLVADAVDSDVVEEIVDVEVVEDHVVEPSVTMRRNGAACLSRPLSTD
jgi:hypothetical protein